MVLANWMQEHLDDPYASDDQLLKLCEQTCMTAKDQRARVKTWLENARRRYWDKEEKCFTELGERLLDRCVRF